MFGMLGMFDPHETPTSTSTFSPYLLFVSGEQGAWYDPSDFRSMFQDAAGATPVTAIEQPVGLILDKSGNNNHASQSTTTSRPILRNLYNLLVQTATLSTQNVTTRATNHKLSFSGAGTITLSGTATGTFSAGTNTFTATAGTLTLTVSGTVTEAMLTEANDGNVPYQWVTTGNQSVTNPSVNIVTAGYDTDVTKFPPFLFFDGSDDWLSTGNINFSATDMMSVFAGVRKLNDANNSSIVELSEAWDNNAGTFQVSTFPAGGSNYTYASRGTANSTILTSGYPSPTSNILSLVSTISGDSLLQRINGSQTALSTSDQGSGNYGNYPLYIGRRGGTTLPFTGRIYSLIIRGALTSSPQLEQTETWVAGKTGVTL